MRKLAGATRPKSATKKLVRAIVPTAHNLRISPWPAEGKTENKIACTHVVTGPYIEKTPEWIESPSLTAMALVTKSPS